MGNVLGFGPGEDDELILPREGFGYNVINLTVDAMDLQVRSRDYHPNNLPVIREKPNLDKFQVSTK